VIVCICNCIRGSEVQAGSDRGIDSAPELFASLETEPRCGSCVPEIEELLASSRYAPASNSPAAV
jgi:bacterioferritin-associated ferredoxin